MINFHPGVDSYNLRYKKCSFMVVYFFDMWEIASYIFIYDCNSNVISIGFVFGLQTSFLI